MEVTATSCAYLSIAESLIAQSKNSFASFFILSFLTKAFASKSQPEPSFGNTTSIGSPLDNYCVALYPSVIPIGYSPEPANFAGFEPECVYVAIFLCNLSM